VLIIEAAGENADTGAVPTRIAVAVAAKEEENFAMVTRKRRCGKWTMKSNCLYWMEER